MSAMTPRRAVGLIVLGVMVVVWSSQKGWAQSLDKPGAVAALQQEAITLYRAGHYEQAARRYRRLVKLQPQNTEFLKDLMWVLWYAGHPEEVVHTAVQLTSARPDDREAWNLLGSAYTTLGKHEEAIKALKNSLRLDPEQFPVWRAVARLQIELHQYDQARQLLTQVLARAPQAVECLPVLARAQMLQGAFADAAKSWARAREAFPDRLAYAYQEANALYQGGQSDQAIARVEDLIHRHRNRLDDPEQFPVWRAVARLQIELHQYDQARQLLTQLLARAPQAVECLPVLARAQMLQGAFADAAKSWARAREAFPDRLAYAYQEASTLYLSGQIPQAQTRLQTLVKQHQAKLLHDDEQLPVARAIAQLYLDVGQYGQAIQWLTQCLHHHPQEGSFYPLLARAQTSQGSFAEAAQSWAKAVKVFPDRLNYHHQQAVALYQSGEQEQALKILQKFVQEHEDHLLDADQLPVWRAISQLALDLREYELAERLLTPLVQHNPQEGLLYPPLARAQTSQGSFAEAAQSWAKAVKFFPDRLNYHHQQAVALYHSGQYEQAVAVLQDLVHSHPEYAPGMNLLTDFAIVQRDWATAVQLLEQELASPKPGDELLLLKLANVYQISGQPKLYMQTLDRCLRLTPTQGEALSLKAEQFRREGRLSIAATLYRQVLALNPWSSSGLAGLADVEQIRGRYARAIRLNDRLRQLDPTDPYLVFTHAQYLYTQGRLKASKRLLVNWLQDNRREPVLPIMVYHGLVKSEDDPLLASPVNMTVATFEDQIHSLRERGFTPVTMDEVDAWYRGAGTLPDRPVCITLDDARLDSFQNADPILARYDFKAAMFVPLSNVEPNFPGYAPWKEIRRYQQTGRWEIQSHGGYGHTYIPLDAEGHKGLFLVNRRWLADQGRLETAEEWQQRIAEDHRYEKATISSHLGTTPFAFAFPEGNFGQVGTPNVNDAAPVNLESANQHFRLVFHEGHYGLNVRSEHPTLLARLLPDPTWSGAELIYHIIHRSPFVLAHVTLLRQAAWQGRLREARRWLDELQADGVLDSMQLVERARIHFSAGDPGRGRALLARALQTSPPPEIVQNAELLLQGNPRWTWTPSVIAQEDNKGRREVVFDQELGSWAIGPTVWRLKHRSGWFHERGVHDVLMHGGGLETTLNLGLFHQLYGTAMGDFLTGDTSAVLAASTGWRARWFDSLTTGFEVGQSPIETARALNAGVLDRYVSLRSDWNTEGLWGVSLQGRASDLSDDNRRYTASAELSKGLNVLPSVRLLYRATFDHTERVSPNYYSPRQLFLNQVGVGFHTQLWKDIGLSIRYLPGYGHEEGSHAGFVQTLELELPVQWKGRPWLKPMLFLNRTPTYQSTGVGLALQFGF